MNSPVQKIKERLGIEEVVSSYIKLEKAGSTLKAKCPFHNEKTPSFFVSTERNNYYCFGCGAKGDIFTFVQEFEGLDFKGTLKILAERAGVSLSEYKPTPEENNKDILYKLMEESTRFFESNLSTNTEAIEYLKKRGLSLNSIKDFSIGFAKLEWNELMFFLKKKGFSEKNMEEAGLIKKGSNGKYYDRFRGRIMFPIKDSSGRVIAFSGRIFVDDGKSAKYLNSPETPIFSKSNVLYGIDKAKDSIRRNDFSILVEGQMDLILSHQAGFRNTVASSGTALSEAVLNEENSSSNLGLIRRFSGNIVIAFDADKAGFSASDRAAKIALSLDMDVKVVDLPLGVDPADIISKEGPQKWKEAIKNSKHIVEFMTERILKMRESNPRKALEEIKEKVFPYITEMDSSAKKAFSLKKVSEMSGLFITDLEKDFRLKEKEKENSKDKGFISKNEVVDKKKKDRIDYILKRLMGILFWQDGLKENTINVEKLTLSIEKILGIDKNQILANMKEDQGDLIFEAEVFYDKGKDLMKDVNELLLNLEEETLRENLSRKMFDLKKVEKDKDSKSVEALLKEIKDITIRIENLKNNRSQI